MSRPRATSPRSSPTRASALRLSRTACGPPRSAPAPVDDAPESANPMIVLGVETSCDETSVAVLDGDGRVRANVIASQMAAHARYGGVVPEVAARAHLENLPGVFEEALARAGIALSDVGLV